MDQQFPAQPRPGHDPSAGAGEPPFPEATTLPASGTTAPFHQPPVPPVSAFPATENSAPAAVDAQDQPAKKGRSWRIGYLSVVTALLVILADQVLKIWVQDQFAVFQGRELIGPLYLTYIQNTGAALGILPNQTVFLSIVAGIVAVVLLYYTGSSQTRSPLLQVALGFMLGGAVGNLIDRITLGYVVDMFDLRNAAGQNIFPVFNIADSAITVGVILLAAHLLIFDRPRRETATGDAPPLTDKDADRIARAQEPLPEDSPYVVLDDGHALELDPESRGEGRPPGQT